MPVDSIESDDEGNAVGPEIMLEESESEVYDEQRSDYQIPTRAASRTEPEYSSGAHDGLTGDFGGDLLVSRKPTCDESVQTDLVAPPQSEMYRMCHCHHDAIES
jgi:hypothetical protein